MQESFCLEIGERDATIVKRTSEGVYTGSRVKYDSYSAFGGNF
jgi:hypothetical protein